jgi:hypothetical protein
LEEDVKYVILIYGNPASREAWEGFSADERAEGLDAYRVLNEELEASGELIVAEALADPSHATSISVREGRPITSDGPFAEAKEQLAGFFLLDCESDERAIEVAARVPEAEFGLVEVRPVMDLNAFEL